jgi:hypothetical protein
MTDNTGCKHYPNVSIIDEDEERGVLNICTGCGKRWWSKEDVVEEEAIQ